VQGAHLNATLNRLHLHDPLKRKGGIGLAARRHPPSFAARITARRERRPYGMAKMEKNMKKQTMVYVLIAGFAVVHRGEKESVDDYGDDYG